MNNKNRETKSAEGMARVDSSGSNGHRRLFLCGKTPTKVLPRLLIAEEVAILLRKSPKTVYKWAAAGLIPSINLNGNILLDQDEILAWIDDHRMAA